MGQHWILANLDKRQKASLGRHEEFWDTALVFLDNFLCYRPIYLADLEDVQLPQFGGQVPSATVCATGSPSVASQNKRKPSDGALPDCDDGGSHPPKRAKQTSIAARLSLSSYSTTAPLSTPYLSLLPAELIDRICTHLPDHIEVTLFALTSRRHWQICRRHIRSRIEGLCNWAGDRLICLGSYAEDLPLGLLTAAEEKELEMGYTPADDMIEDDESDDDDDYDDYDENDEYSESHEYGEGHEDNAKTTRISLYEVAKCRFTEQVDIELNIEVGYRLSHMNGCHSDVRKDCDLLLSLTYPEYARTRHGVRSRTHGPEAVGLRQVYWKVPLRWPQAERAEQWAVLRNLSRREYVHGKALQEVRDRDHGLENPWVMDNIMSFGFGEVLGLRSFWSETEQGSPYDWDYCRGVWAGHRFDIVLEQDHEKAIEKEEWKDVSEEALAEILKVCQKGFE